MMLRPIAALALLTLVTLPARADDWPQLAHDPARSGATADQLKPPFSRKWYRLFADEGIQAGVEPVVVRGRLYIGTLRGIVHAIDAKTGQDVWTYKQDYPAIWQTSCLYQTVARRTYDHRTHAFSESVPPEHRCVVALLRKDTRGMYKESQLSRK